jgi:Transposase DNA-binding/Transposase Tn5 dimerisation domain
MTSLLPTSLRGRPSVEKRGGFLKADMGVSISFNKVCHRLMHEHYTSGENKEVDGGWARWEFRDVALGDARVERRLQRVAEDLFQQPEYPINQACEDAAATKAAYRLFDNEKASSVKIFSTHQARTQERMRGEPVVLAIQDTTFFNFSGHKKTTGLGPIGDSKADAQGLILHSTLAVTPGGLPLGVLTHRCWARAGYKNSNETCEGEALEKKESYRWIETLKEVSNLAVAQAASMVVTVADRECDIYEFLLEAQKLNSKYVIRACYDRHLRTDGFNTLQSHLATLKPQGQVEVEVPTQRRVATLNLLFTQVEIRPPDRITKSKKAPGVSCWVIHVREPIPPKGLEPLTWTLLTNIPVLSLEQGVERLAWYRRRWSIEEFHKIIKSGCAVEQCRLETAERLKRYITLFCVIAWRIFWMVHIRRANPNAPAEVVLTYAEVETLSTLRRFRGKLPQNGILSVHQALTAVACLGGYLNRKNDPPPGATVLWRGWQRLASMAELYESMLTESG